jgi:hypothetical protein
VPNVVGTGELWCNASRLSWAALVFAFFIITACGRPANAETKWYYQRLTSSELGSGPIN